jgi:hypothetical protein
MIKSNAWNILIRCQNHTQVRAEVPVNAGDSMHDGVTIRAQDIREGDVRIGELALEIHTQTLTDTPFMEMEHPVQVRIPVEERPEKITAFYMFDQTCLPGRSAQHSRTHADRAF